MTQLEEILTGWKNVIFPNENVEKLAKDRIKICLDKKICKKLTSNNRCSICGCYMPVKVRSPKSKCPKAFW